MPKIENTHLSMRIYIRILCLNLDLFFEKSVKVKLDFVILRLLNKDIILSSFNHFPIF